MATVDARASHLQAWAGLLDDACRIFAGSLGIAVFLLCHPAPGALAMMGRLTA
jgi:hypothetical protein